MSCDCDSQFSGVPYTGIVGNLRVTGETGCVLGSSSRGRCMRSVEAHDDKGTLDASGMHLVLVDMVIVGRVGDA